MSVFLFEKKAPNRCALVIMDNHILTQKKNLLAVLFRMVPKLIFCMIMSEYFKKEGVFYGE